MKSISRFTAVLGAVGLAAAVAYAPAASADRVGFSISVGGPGYGFTAGNYGGYYGGYYAPPPVIVTPAPVYRPYYRPYYAPGPVFVAPPVVVRPYPVYRPAYRGYYDTGYYGRSYRGDDHRHYYRDDRHRGRGRHD